MFWRRLRELSPRSKVAFWTTIGCALVGVLLIPIERQSESAVWPSLEDFLNGVMFVALLAMHVSIRLDRRRKGSEGA